MKAIILAAGKGTRLLPNTKAASKHLMNVYDKPLIYYSLSSVMLAGIQDVALISTTRDLPLYQHLLGDGSHLGMNITYFRQDFAKGIPDAYTLTEKFLDGQDSLLALGDNVFHGTGFSTTLRHMTTGKAGATILLKQVPDPNRFGIAEIDANGQVVSLVEKPVNSPSDFAITGLYVLDGTASARAKEIKPSLRGELEMVDLLSTYLDSEELASILCPRGTMWLDTGTVDSMLDAAIFVRAFQSHTGNLIGSPEEIAFRNGWISSSKFETLVADFKNEYGSLLKGVLAHG